MREYSSYLEERYGAKTYRLSVDAGFSCPNRDKDRSRGGCSFCGSSGSRSAYLGSREALDEQISGAMAFLRRRYAARRFLLYFQAFSGTYAPVEELKRIYDYALSLGDFRELIVSTRPDCLEAEKADLLAGYKKPDRDVWVELGLQSAQEKTLRRIRRGHTLAEFEAAFSLLRARGIKTAVHLVFGLPGENAEDIEATLRYVAELKPEGLKIHNLHIVRTASLYHEFLSGELVPPCALRHLDWILRADAILPEETIVMRYTCDTPPDLLAYPRRFPEKGKFLNLLRRALARTGD